LTERAWDRFFTEQDRAVFAATGFGGQPAWGRRPVLIVVDVNYAFCDTEPLPILESVKRWPTSCGERGWAAIPTLSKLIELCRHRGVPVVYTTSSQRSDRWTEGSWRWKNVRLTGGHDAADGVEGSTIVADIAPRRHDIVVRKDKPSAFFGTPLASYLQMLGCDTVLVCGATTSGCVRATVVDAFSLNFRCGVIEDACFDRSEASHAVSLGDMAMKYASVVTSRGTAEYLESIPTGSFELPTGEGIDERGTWY